MADYKKDLINRIKSKEGYATSYLNAALEDSIEALLVALRDVAQARKGMTNLAKATSVNRVNLYHMLSKKGNPGVRNVVAILDALDLKISLSPKEASSSPPRSTPSKLAFVRESRNQRHHQTSLIIESAPRGISVSPLGGLSGRNVAGTPIGWADRTSHNSAASFWPGFIASLSTSAEAINLHK